MKSADSINVGYTHGPCIQGPRTWCNCWRSGHVEHVVVGRVKASWVAGQWSCFSGHESPLSTCRCC